MRAKALGCFFLCLILPNCYAAFNEKESSQLRVINENASVELKIVRKELNESIKVALSDNPERKDEILKLAQAWQGYIESKCSFEIFDTKGTDAETASKKQCMTLEVMKEVDYFNNILP